MYRSQNYLLYNMSYLRSSLMLSFIVGSSEFLENLASYGLFLIGFIEFSLLHLERDLVWN